MIFKDVKEKDSVVVGSSKYGYAFGEVSDVMPRRFKVALDLGWGLRFQIADKEDGSAYPEDPDIKVYPCSEDTEEYKMAVKSTEARKILKKVERLDLLLGSDNLKSLPDDLRPVDEAIEAVLKLLKK
jgi:hypothetical protein